MKNLQKILALVLALVMVVGMLGVSAAAFDLSKYSDAGSITYEEAIEVMSEIGVIDGFDDGTLRPNETLTRAQAAKIIAYIVLGKTAADSLSTTTAPFTDVAATNWAAGAIAYCVSAGIVDGYGDGTFGPNDTLTAYQWAKMLLCAIGYGTKDEFTGSVWAIEVAKLALNPDINLFKGNGGDANNNPISRQSAMQCALNALDVPKVRYSELLGGYSSSLLNSTSIDYGTLMEIHNLTKVPTADRLGYAGHKWQVKNKDISDVYVDDVIVATYTDTEDVTLGMLANLGDWDKGYTTVSGSNYYDFKLYINGVEGLPNYYGTGTATQLFDATAIARFLSSVSRGNSTTLNSYLSGYGLPRYSGVEINVVQDPGTGEIYKIVMVFEYLAEVTKINAATASADRSVNLSVFDGLIYDTAASTLAGEAVYGGMEHSITYVETDDFALDDYILIAPVGVPSENTNDVNWGGFKDPLYMKSAESVTANITAVTAGKGTFTFGGNTYRYSTTADEKVALASLDFSTTYVFYLGSYGTVIGSKVDTEGTTTSNLAYVSAAEYNSGNSFTGAYLKVRLYYMDGTTEILNVSVKTASASMTGIGSSTIASGEKYVTIGGNNFGLGVAATTTSTDVLNGVYSYRTSSGNATLNAVNYTPAAPALTADFADATASKIELYANDAEVNFTTLTNLGSLKLYASKTTVLTLADSSGATSYTGFANFPNKTYEVGQTTTIGTRDTVKVEAIVVAYVGSNISSILVVGAPAVAAKADNYAIFVGKGSAVADDQYYDFYVNGATESRLLSSTSDTPSGYIPGNAATYEYYGYSVGTDGKATATLAEVDRGTLNSSSSSVVVVGGVTYYLSSSIQVYNITGAKPPEYYSTSLSRNNGALVDVVYSTNASGQLVAEVIYIVG